VNTLNKHHAIHSRIIVASGLLVKQTIYREPKTWNEVR
jgi:hypothetical protein